MTANEPVILSEAKNPDTAPTHQIGTDSSKIQENENSLLIQEQKVGKIAEDWNSSQSR